MSVSGFVSVNFAGLAHQTCRSFVVSHQTFIPSTAASGVSGTPPAEETKEKTRQYTSYLKETTDFGLFKAVCEDLVAKSVLATLEINANYTHA